MYIFKQISSSLEKEEFRGVEGFNKWSDVLQVM